MARFDFQSPGAAFTDQIANQLAERKANERQRMLDQLTVNADQRAAEQAQRQAAESEAQLAQMAHQQELQDLEVIRSGLTMGRAPTDSKAVSLLEKYGLMRDMPSPQVSTSTEFSGSGDTQMEGPTAGPMERTPPAPPRRGYIGTAEVQAKDRLRSQSASLISGLMQDPKTRENGAFLAQLASANDGVVPADIMAQLMAPGKAGVVFDVEGGFYKDAAGKRITGSLPSNAHIAIQTRPPRQLQPKTPMFMGVNDKGEPVFRVVETGEQFAGEGLTPSRTGNAGGSNAGEALGIPASIFNDLTLAEGAIGTDPRSVDETALANYRRGWTLAIANHVKKSQVAKQLAIQYLNNPNQTFESVARLMREGKLTEKDVQDFRAITSIISDTTKDILNQNPYDPTKEKPGFWSSMFGSK